MQEMKCEPIVRFS